MIPVRGARIIPPKNRTSQRQIVNKRREVTKGTGMVHAPLSKENMVHRRRECFDLYPPMRLMMAPPIRTPKVGLVRQTIENEKRRLFSSRMLSSTSK